MTKQPSTPRIAGLGTAAETKTNAANYYANAGTRGQHLQSPFQANMTG